jgi:hypothetical protein
MGLARIELREWHIPSEEAMPSIVSSPDALIVLVPLARSLHIATCVTRRPSPDSVADPLRGAAPYR